MNHLILSPAWRPVKPPAWRRQTLPHRQQTFTGAARTPQQIPRSSTAGKRGYSVTVATGLGSTLARHAGKRPAGCRLGYTSRLVAGRLQPHRRGS